MLGLSLRPRSARLALNLSRGLCNFLLKIKSHSSNNPLNSKALLAILGLSIDFILHLVRMPLSSLSFLNINPLLKIAQCNLSVKSSSYILMWPILMLSAHLPRAMCASKRLRCRHGSVGQVLMIATFRI